MIWVSYRQFRGQGLMTVVLLVAAAILCLVTGLHMHHTYNADLSTCILRRECGNVLSHFHQGYNAALDFCQILVIAFPGLIGMFWGAPLIGRELDGGTDQLAWNQSVTRTRWLASKLMCIGVASIVTAAVLSYLLTWWAGPLDHITGSRYAATTFASRDVVPLAYAAFAFTLGTTAGLLLRRTVPAMALTLAVFIGIQILVPNVVRPHLLPSTTRTVSIDVSAGREARGISTTGGGAAVQLQLPVPTGAWVTSAPPIENSSGQIAASAGITKCLFPPTFTPVGKQAPPINQITGCLTRYHLHESITYQPASHYWPLQWYESGIYLAFALALSGACFWFIRRA